MIFDQRYYYNQDGTKAYPENHPEAHSLIGPKGHEIDDERAKELGIAPKAKSLKEAPETKQVKGKDKEQAD